MMKKRIMQIVAVVLVLSLTIGLFSMFRKKEAEAALGGMNENAKVKILEIVPSKACAEIGYLIQGQEPIAEALYEKNTDPNADYPYVTYKLPDDPKVYIKKNEANYANPSFVQKITNNMTILTAEDQLTCFKWENGELVNLNLLLDSALGPTVTITDISEQEYFKYIQVDTVLATELEAKLAADPDYYKQYNLIYVATGQHYGQTVALYNTFMGTNVASNITYSTSNDMTWNAAYKLFIANKVDGIPLIIDAKDGTQNYALNVGKLCLLVRQCSYPYYTNYVLPHLDVNTGAVDGATTWNTETLRNNTWTWPSGFNYDTLEQYGILDKAPSWQHVLLDGNTWVYDGNSSIIGGWFVKKADDTNNSMEFIKEVYPDINARAEYTGIITKGDVLRYLLNLTPIEELSRTAYVLEIQPVSFFEYITHEYTDPTTGTVKKAYGPVYDASGKLLNGNTEQLKILLRRMGYLPTDKSLSNLKVEALCTAAFNALKVDLNNYEYIHLGSKLGPSASMQVLNTDRNDDSLDGYYYTAEGDSMAVNIKLSGTMISDYTTQTQNQAKSFRNYNGTKLMNWLFGERDLLTANEMASDSRHQLNWLYHNGAVAANDNYKVRLSGNDLTEAKKKELIKYVESRRVLTISDKLLNSAGTAVNSTTVDPKSEIDDLIDQVLGQPTVVGTIKDYNKLTVAYAKANRFPDIIFATDGKPIEYDGTNFVTKNASSKYTYAYKFKIKGTANTKYVAKVYLDINGDGIYRENAEGEYESELAYVSSENGVEILTNTRGYTDDYVNISFEIPENMSGMIPWKLAVYQVNVDASGVESLSDLVYTTKIGYSACEPSEKRDIYVLQITYGMAIEGTIGRGGKIVNRNQDGKRSGIVLDNWTYKNVVSRPEDIHENPAKYREFYELIAAVKDYNINIISVSAEEFAKWYDPNQWTYKYHLETDPETGKDILVKDALASRGVKFNASDGVTSGEDKISDVFDMVMMGYFDSYGESFGVTANDNGAVSNIRYYIEEGNSVLFCHDAVGYNYNRSGSGWGYSLSTSLRDIVGMDKYGIMGTSYSNAFSNYSYSDGLKQGFSNMLIIRQANDSDKNAQKLPFNYLFNSSVVINNWKDYLPQTTRAVKLNTGFITQYPNVIGEEIDIRRTHAQWCQLNLEDEEVMVWYTLDGLTDDYNTTLDNQAKYSTNIYKYNRKDGANNFYIYSKGNITYSGAGHQTYEDTNFTASELKLFINTMVAAIKAANNPPQVTILNGSKDFNEKNAYIFSVDESAMQAELSFHVFDPDIIDGSKVKDVKAFYDQNNNGTYDAGDILVSHYTDDTTQITRTDEAYRNNRSDVIMLKGQDESLGIAECIKSATWNSAFSEECLYVTIEATDAKGRKGFAKVKVKISELFDLD